MDQLKVLVVEDELIIAEDIKGQLVKMGYQVTDISSSFDEAIQSLEKTVPDLVMLDIMIKGAKNGIDIAKHLREKHPRILIIFLSSLSDKRTVEQVKETRPDAYLLKPFRPEHLFTSIEIAVAKISAEAQPEETSTKVVKDSLFLKKDHLFYKVKIKDILFFKSEGNYLVIHVISGKKYTIRQPVKDFMDMLKDYSFFQIHKSYVVNLDYVDAVSPSSVKIQEHEVPLAKSKKDEFMDLMQSFS